MEFKDKLKEMRKKRGLSQQALAEKVLISRSAVAKWENGLSLPNEQSLALLADFFEVGVNELLVNRSTEETIVTKNNTISKMQKFCIALTAAIILLVTAFSVLSVMYIIGLKKSEQSPPPTAVENSFAIELLENGNQILKRGLDGSTYSQFISLPADTVFRFINEKNDTVIAAENVEFYGVPSRLLDPSKYFILEENTTLEIKLEQNEDGKLKITVSRSIEKAYGNVKMCFCDSERPAIDLTPVISSATENGAYYLWSTESILLVQGEKIYFEGDGEIIYMSEPTVPHNFEFSENGTIEIFKSGVYTITVETTEAPAAFMWETEN